jgi:hypothetical protein
LCRFGRRRGGWLLGSKGNRRNLLLGWRCLRWLLRCKGSRLGLGRRLYPWRGGLGHLGRLCRLRIRRGSSDFLGPYLRKSVGYRFLLPANRCKLLGYLGIVPLVRPRLENERNQFFAGHQTTWQIRNPIL